MNSFDSYSSLRSAEKGAKKANRFAKIDSAIKWEKFRPIIKLCN